MDYPDKPGNDSMCLLHIIWLSLPDWFRQSRAVFKQRLDTPDAPGYDTLWEWSMPNVQLEY
jgi:hypothetical protein